MLFAFEMCSAASNRPVKRGERGLAPTSPRSTGATSNSVSAGPASSTSHAIQLPHELMIWLEQVPVDPIPESLVPGASEHERRHLTAAASIVKALLQGRQGPRDAHRVLDRYLPATPAPPDHVLLQASQFIVEYGDAGLAELYSSLVAAPHRRRLGTFFTPPQEVDAMMSHWSDSQPDPTTVIDVGAGVGIFTTAAARRWSRAVVWAIDINPITLALLTASVTLGQLAAPSRDRAGVRLALCDYIGWAQRQWSHLPGGRLIIGNPPYTRLQLLPISDRQRLWEAAGGLCGRRASLSALITAFSLTLLEPADGLCLLLPAQWLESQYASKLRHTLWNQRDRRIELTLFESGLFDDALVDAVALLVGTSRDESQPILIRSADNHGREIDRGRPCPPSWRGLFSTTSPPPARKSHHVTVGGAPTDKVSVRLADFGTVRRGIATGNNDFFTLSEARRQFFQIPRSHLAPLIRRLRDFADVIDSDHLASLEDRIPRWLLLATSARCRECPALNRYLVSGIAAGVPDAELCRRRAEWFDLGPELYIPDVIIGPMTQAEFRIAENTAAATITNNLYGIRWHSAVTAEARATVVAWLRAAAGQHALIRSARRQADGLSKVEPAALRDLSLPNSFVELLGGSQESLF